MALKQRNRCLAGGSKQMFWACLSFLVQVWWSCFQRHNCYLNRWYLILTCFNIYFCFFNSFFHFANGTGSERSLRCARAPSWTVRQSDARESTVPLTQTFIPQILTRETLSLFETTCAKLVPRSQPGAGVPFLKDIWKLGVWRWEKPSRK